MKPSNLLVVMFVALAALTSCGGQNEDSVNLSYAPWTDLSAYFDLSSVKKLEGSNILTFNSYEMTNGRLPMTSDRIDNSEYSAVILGTGVWMRSQPVIKNSTKRTQLNTGRVFVVTKHNIFANNRFWHYGYVTYPGEDVYDAGYVCADYVVGKEQYAMIKKYLFQQGSNLNYTTPSKMLHAAADVLLKFRADILMPNLYVSMLNQYPLGMHTIVVYQIRDYGAPSNNCMLAVVQFDNNNNSFKVIGIVPGYTVNQVQPNANGSYDIYFN